MVKIQFIIDDEKSLKAYTCTDVDIEMPTLSYFETMLDYKVETIPQYFRFTARNIITDDSPALISLPDELLLRIRDYNIDTERQHAIEQTFKLKDKIKTLEDQVRGWEFRRDLAEEEYEKWDLAHLVVKPTHISARKYYWYTMVLYYTIVEVVDKFHLVVLTLV